MKSTEFRQAVTAASACVDSDHPRINVAGLHLCSTGTSLIMTATDGYAMTEHTVAAKLGAWQTMVNVTALKCLFPACIGAKEVGLQLIDDGAWLELNGIVQVRIRPMQDRFVKVDRVWEQVTSHTRLARLHTSEFRQFPVIEQPNTEYAVLAIGTGWFNDDLLQRVTKGAGVVELFTGADDTAPLLITGLGFRSVVMSMNKGRTNGTRK